MVARYEGPGRQINVPDAPRGARADAPRRFVDSSLVEVGRDLVAAARQGRAVELQAKELEERRLERAEREAERERLKQERIDRNESLGLASDLEVQLSAELAAMEQERDADPTGWAGRVRERLQERVAEATQSLRPGLAEFAQERLLPFVERASIGAISQEATWQGVRSVETHGRNADALARLAAFREDSVAESLVELRTAILEDPYIAKGAKGKVFAELAGRVAEAQLESVIARHPEAAGAIRQAVQGEVSASSPFVTVPVRGRPVEVALGLVDPGKVVGVVERAQRELEARAREAAVAEREARVDALAGLKTDLADVLTAAEYGEPVARLSRDRFAVLGEGADAAYEQFTQQFDAAAKRGAARTMTGAELMDMLEQARPRASADGTAPGFEATAEQFARTQRVVAAELDRRAKAPVAFAREVSEPLRAAEAAVTEARAAGDREALRRAAARRLDLLFETQREYGLPATVLDDGERQQLAERLSGAAMLGATPRDRAAAQVTTLDAVRDEYGAYTPDVLRAVGRDAPGGTATQARLSDRPMGVRLAVAEAWAVPADELARALPAGLKAEDIRLDAQEDTRAFIRSLGARHGAVTTASETQEAVERLAMVYAARGVGDPVARATADVLGEYAFEELAGRVVRVPAGERVDFLARGLRRALANERDRYPDLRDLAWVTLPDDSGVQLLSGDTPVLTGRNPVTRTWMQLREEAATDDERGREIRSDVRDALYGPGAPLL